MHWDGQKWDIKRIIVNFRGNEILVPLEGAQAFSENDIWFVGSLPIHGDGNSWVMYDLRTTLNPNLSFSKVWGSSSNNIYFAGNNGGIAHYDGTNWQKIESGTTLPINDIWGDYDEKRNKWEILAVAGDRYYDYGQEVLNIKETGVSNLNKTGLPWSLSSTWFKTNREYFVAGDGLFSNKKLNENWIKKSGLLPYYKDRVRGDSFNNIFVSGSNGFLAHYNGSSWYNYLNNDIPYFSGRLMSLSLKNNLVIAVGWKERSAIIIMGIR